MQKYRNTKIHIQIYKYRNTEIKEYINTNTETQIQKYRNAITETEEKCHTFKINLFTIFDVLYNLVFFSFWGQRVGRSPLNIVPLHVVASARTAVSHVNQGLPTPSGGRVC